MFTSKIAKIIYVVIFTAVLSVLGASYFVDEVRNAAVTETRATANKAINDARIATVKVCDTNANNMSIWQRTKHLFSGSSVTVWKASDKINVTPRIRPMVVVNNNMIFVYLFAMLSFGVGAVFLGVEASRNKKAKVIAKTSTPEKSVAETSDAPLEGFDTDAPKEAANAS